MLPACHAVVAGLRGRCVVMGIFLVARMVPVLFLFFESFCIETSPGTVFLPGDVVVCCVFYSVC